MEQTEHGFVRKGDSSMIKTEKEEQSVLKTEKELSKEDISVRSNLSETWAQETIEDLDDFIESQGIYIRQ